MSIHSYKSYSNIYSTHEAFTLVGVVEPEKLIYQGHVLQPGSEYILRLNGFFTYLMDNKHNIINAIEPPYAHDLAMLMKGVMPDGETFYIDVAMEEVDTSMKNDPGSLYEKLVTMYNNKVKLYIEKAQPLNPHINFNPLYIQFDPVNVIEKPVKNMTLNE